MGAILDLPEVRERVRRWTVADYVALTENNPLFCHSELIRGIIVEKMSKSPLHMKLTKRAYDLFLRSVRKGLVVRQEGPIHLVDSLPEPDISIVPSTPDEYEFDHPTTAELVSEIAVTSVALDRENASLYAEASVAEYWIVLAELGTIEVYRHPENGRYLETRTYACGESIPCVCIDGEGVPVSTLFA